MERESQSALLSILGALFAVLVAACLWVQAAGVVRSASFFTERGPVVPAPALEPLPSPCGSNDPDYALRVLAGPGR